MSPGARKTPPAELSEASVPRGVLGVLERLQSAGHEAYLVGGCVRDLVLERVPQDWDVATQALPAEVQGLFQKVIPTGIAHGTVTVLVAGGQVEVTTYRVEAGYADGRRPDKVEFRRDLVEDLARRDFTINAMAFNPRQGEFRDPFDGRLDLRRKLVRCVGDAVSRFGEDGLRPLRAVRFATVLDFELDDATASAIPAALDVFRKVAKERVRDEFLKLLLAPGVSRGLRLLQATGLLGAGFPELESPLTEETLRRVGASPPRPEVRLAALLLGAKAPGAALARLKLPARLVEDVQALLAHPVAAGWSDAEVRRWAAGLGRARVPEALALATAEGLDPATRAQVERVLAAHPPLSVRELALGGQAVMESLGIGPSPLVGEATRWLLEQVLEDPGRNTESALREALRSWAQARGLKPGPLG